MKDMGTVHQHVLVIGGGASGVLMAAHLLKQDGIQVTLVEKGELLGCGIAYSTTDPDHLLNTRVHNMSAFADQPEHFHDWLTEHGRPRHETDFVSRATYGDYMQDLLTPWRGNPRLTLVKDEATRLQAEDGGITLTLGSGQQVRGDRAILATGHAVPEATPGLDNAWHFDGGIDPDARVVIIGSGLSMIDQTLSLLKGGHRGQIVSVSRRGLLPLAHGTSLPRPTGDEPPFGAEISWLLHWMRTTARNAEANGGSWRDAVDGVRPHAHRLWREMTITQRKRFLRHAGSWWGVHRHRIPPASWNTILDALTRGQLELRRGRFDGMEDNHVRILHPDRSVEEIAASRVIDCRGILRDLETHGSPLIRDLLKQGIARMDPLRVGLDVTLHCQLIAQDGTVQQRIQAIGPVSRAAFWEITAIPDIRAQVAELASQPETEALA